MTIGPGASDRLQLANNAVFSNLAAGTVLISSTNANPFVHNSGGSAHQLINAGLIQKTSAGTQTLLNQGSYTQSAGGQLDVDAGTLNLFVNGGYTGTLNVDAGATLAFNGGTHNLDAGVGFTGAGALQVAGGTMTVNTPLTFGAATPVLAMSSGTINGAGALTVDNAFTLSGGTLTGAGLLTTNGASSIANAPLLDGRT